MIKIVVFVDNDEEEVSCHDEKWRRLQITLCDKAYKDLKKAVLKIRKKHDC